MKLFLSSSFVFILVTLVIVSSLISSVSSTPASQTSFTNLFGMSKDNVKVIFLADFEDANDKADFYSDPARLVPVGLSNSSKYHCHIPDRVSTEESDEVWRKHLSKLQNRPLPEHFSRKINSALAELCFTYPKDWWTYKLCWNKNVRQFHADSHGKVEAEFFLGKGPEMKLKDGASTEFLYDVDPTDPTRARLVTEWFNGTECDITKREREMILYLKCPAISSSSSSNENNNGKKKASSSTNNNGRYTTVDSAGQPNPFMQAQFVVDERAGTCVYEATLTHEVFCNIPELRPRERPESIVRCIDVTTSSVVIDSHHRDNIEIGNFEEIGVTTTSTSNEDEN